MVNQLAEDDELAMYEHSMDRLAAAGFEHYEISNFARAGQPLPAQRALLGERGVLRLWRRRRPVCEGIRELNTRDTKLYVRKVLAGESPTFQRRSSARAIAPFETIGTQLPRPRESTGRFREQTGIELEELMASPSGVSPRPALHPRCDGCAAHTPRQVRCRRHDRGVHEIQLSGYCLRVGFSGRLLPLDSLSFAQG